MSWWFRKHLEALKLHVETVAEEMNASEHDDPTLRQELGALAIKLGEKIQRIKYGEEAIE